MKLTTDNLTFLVYPLHARPPVAGPSSWIYLSNRTESTKDGELTIVLRNTSTRLSINLRDYPGIVKVILQDPPDGS